MRILVAVCLITLSIPSFAKAQDQATKLTTLAKPSFREFERTKRRFRFLLPALSKSCGITQKRVADQVFAAFQMLEKAGMEKEEGLLQLFNNIHLLTNQIKVYKGGKESPCHEWWASYVTLREIGYSPEKSMRTLVVISASGTSPLKLARKRRGQQ